MLWSARRHGRQMSIVCPSQYGGCMSLAESPASSTASRQTPPQPSSPDGAAPRAQLLPANHLMETVLPVRPALVDRGSAARLKPGMLAELIGSGSARTVVLSGRQALVSGNSLVLLDAAELALFVLPAQFEVRAEEFEAHVAGIPGDAQWAGFREVAARLNATDTALFIEASAIANWHSTHTHCPRCGTPPQPEAGGWVRRCPADNSEHFPRPDPAIIVTVVGPDGRLLLGGGGPLDARNYSTLAGFVEPGESLEQAVR